ncbi:hypothetical protein TNCT_162581 [Trichonephila clavata]|uniref:Uncharacterized protein n=1 Tax=Trichonephila clavata TaxID=2740835 RepID=A0A8X6F9L0_TRICU|nr:hypothetical protein TNCT_162581 [Trichonephila clavata]
MFQRILQMILLLKSMKVLLYLVVIYQTNAAGTGLGIGTSGALATEKVWNRTGNGNAGIGYLGLRTKSAIEKHTEILYPKRPDPAEPEKSTLDEVQLPPVNSSEESGVREGMVQIPTSTSSGQGSNTVKRSDPSTHEEAPAAKVAKTDRTGTVLPGTGNPNPVAMSDNSNGVKIPRPTVSSSTGYMTFNKVHRFVTYGIAYNVLEQKVSYPVTTGMDIPLHGEGCNRRSSDGVLRVSPAKQGTLEENSSLFVNPFEKSSNT